MSKKYKIKVNKKNNLFKNILFFSLFSFILLSLMGLAVFVYFAKDLPNPDNISQREVTQSTKIYDRTGQVILYEIHGEEKRTVIPFEEIPQYIKDATISIEDDNFYHHIGIDIKGIIRAFFANFKMSQKSQGGSTITQQFIKNAVLTSEKTYTRKIKEAILALELERKYSKDEILSFYLNQVPYGSNAYGIESAAQTFFDKSAKDLSLAEATTLASMTQATTYYSPYGSNFDKLKQRQEFLLDKMVDLNYINQEKAEEAKKEQLFFSLKDRNIKAPHFVMYIKEYLEYKYDSDYIEKAGLRVYTTLDYELQKIAEEIVAEGAKNNEKYNASNAALVAIDPKTGHILTMVGSRDYFDIKNQGNYNVATSPNRQPGSSFKPFAYAAAFQKGYTPETILFDLRTNFSQPGSPDYIPRNYDNKFRGPVSMKNSLAQSLNIPSVKTLYLAGMNETIKLAKDMGITTLNNKDQYGLSLVLGGGEVKLIDEVAAYGVFANEGIKNKTVSILKIEDNNGNILEESKLNPVRILDSQIARQINDILSDNEARAPVFGLSSNLYLSDRPVAAKTGTTQENRDGWTVGYTPSIVTGVWVGNNNNSSMNSNVSGALVAAPIWNNFMKEAYKINSNKKDNNFTLPSQVELFTPPNQTPTSTKTVLNGQFAFDQIVKIDRISKKLATNLTPLELIDEVIYKEVHSILYYVDKDNPLGAIPENPAQDPQFINWENPVIEWVKNQPCSLGICYNQAKPTEYDDVHILENQPRIKIISPLNGSNIFSKSIINIKVEAEANLGIKQIDFFYNNKLIGSDLNEPYQITFNLNNYEPGKQYIKVIGYDQVLNRTEDQIYININ